MISRSAVLFPRLFIMTGLAERAPVTFIPEQFLVSTVRDSVIHHSGFDVPSFLRAFDAQRMHSEVCFAGLPPTAVVPAALPASDVLRMERPVCFTVARPRRDQGGAAGMLTWNLRSLWHPDYLHMSGSCDPIKSSPAYASVASAVSTASASSLSAFRTYAR